MLMEKVETAYAECCLVAAAVLGHIHLTALQIFLINCVPSWAEMPSITASYEANCTTQFGLSPRRNLDGFIFHALLDFCPDVDKTPSWTHA